MATDVLAGVARIGGEAWMGPAVTRTGRFGVCLFVCRLDLESVYWSSEFRGRSGSFPSATTRTSRVSYSLVWRSDPIDPSGAPHGHHGTRSLCCGGVLVQRFLGLQPRLGDAELAIDGEFTPATQIGRRSPFVRSSRGHGVLCEERARRFARPGCNSLCLYVM